MDNAAEQKAQLEKIAALNDELSAQKASLEKHLDAVSSLSKLYYASYYVDVDNDEHYELFAGDEVSSAYGEVRAKGKSQAALNWMCDNRIDPEYREAARAFVDYSTLSERMRGTEEVSILVKLVTGDWSRIRFIAGSRHEDGTLKSCTFVVRNVNDEHEAEAKRRRELENLLRVSQAFSRDYLNTLIIDVSTGISRALSLDKGISEAVQIEERKPHSYKEGFERYIAASCHPDDADSLREKVRLENVAAKLENDDDYTIDYRAFYDESTHYFRVRFRKVEGTSNILLGFLNVDDIMIAERQHQKELEENQTRLEEAAAEQEAQLEEITALNDELEERQAQLEEAAAEQEAQLEEISALNDELESQRTALESRLHIIKSLSNRYFAAYYVDIVSDEYIEITSIGNIRRHYKPQGNAQAALTGMVPVLMHPEFKESMQAFVNLPTVAARLKDTESISQRYIGNTTGWSEASFTVCDRDEDGTPISVIFCAREVNDEVRADLERRQELEAARDAANAANAAKSTFLFNMSHDIRTPMNAIIGFTDLIEKHYDDRERCMDYLHKTQEANKFLLSLINNVLEMARIESGKEQLDETVCPTGVVTREMISIFEDQIRQKNISLTSEVDIRTPHMLCDQPKLREICLNILSNAVKYTPEGGSISIQMIEQPCERPGYARIRGVCADTGIGMSKEFLPHLFEDFARAHTSTESHQQGTGLGMPIVKKLVDLMGGTIEVESELGKGTTFTVTIDLRIASAMPEEESETGSETTQADFTGKRILLAEDNDLNAEIAIEILSEAGFEVERAADGVICVDMLQKAERGHFDLVLMDVQMPNMDGYKATGTIRAMKDEEKADIPILAMTANAFEEDKREALRAGMNGHIAKPINVPKLMKTLVGILE